MDRGWTLYTALRRVASCDSNKFKGLWDEGPSYLDVPLNAVVVDSETGELVVARVAWRMRMTTLRQEIEADP